jgi:hypothetical protein
LTVWVLSLIEPFIKPIVQLVTKNLSAGADLVISDKVQYEVFDNPNASDPTHSMLSKDHFSCWLNEPAGQVAIVVVRHAVTEVVAAWSDPSVDPYHAINNIMRVFCHPALLDRNCAVQMEMYGTVERWVNSLGYEDRNRMLQGLTKHGVRQGHHHDANKQDAFAGYGAGPDSHAHGHGHGYAGFSSSSRPSSSGIQGYINQAQQMIGGAFPGQHSGGGGGFGGLAQSFQNVQNLAGQFGQFTGRRREIDESAGDYESPQEYDRPNPPYLSESPAFQGQGYSPPPYPPNQSMYGGQPIYGGGPPYPYEQQPPPPNRPPPHHSQPPNQQYPYGGLPYPSDGSGPRY